MKEIILEKLKAIEEQSDVTILYACESGSRAWGFASPDSDYDVRFIYAHKRDYYLSIDEQRDVIEVPINKVLDINGWELRKALRLFRKSNAPLYEWLQSPIVYQADNLFASELRSLIPVYFSARAGMHHYLSMAKGVLESELSDEKVKLKKYFYALRPVLAATWIAEAGEAPPMSFGELRTLMPENLNKIAEGLLEIKSKVDESFLIDKYSELNDFVAESVRKCEERVPTVGRPTELTALNDLFKKYIV
jgi:predicted nucleotidyltransferase